MDVEGVLAILFIFGGGSLFLLAISPVGKAIAERIRYGRALPPPSSGGVEQEEVLEAVEQLRREVAELAERVDFTERMLGQAGANKLGPRP